MRAGVGVLNVGAMVAGALAVRQARRADTAAVIADAQRVATLARDAESVDSALLLAIEAVRLDDSPETRSSLLAALSRSPALLRSTLNNDPLATVDVSPDGTVVVAGADFYDTVTFERVGGLDPIPWKVAYRSDGGQVAMAISTWSPLGPRVLAPVPVLLVDPKSFEPQPVQLGGLPEGSVEAWDLGYSADGNFLAVSLDVYDGAHFETTVMVWDVAAPERPVQRVEAGQVGAVTLNHDGSLLYVVAHGPPTLTIYDVTTARQIRSIALGDEMALGSDVADTPADGLEISADGTTLAVMDVDEIMVLDAITLAERQRLRGHSAVIQSLQFSRDGSLLASGSDDHTVVVWDVATGTQRERLLGHSGSVWGLAFSPDDATLYSASIDRRLLVWDLRGDRRFVSEITTFEPGGITAFALPAPDGEATVHFTNAWRENDDGSTIHFLDDVTERVGEPISSERGTWSPSWRPPDFEQLAIAGPGGTVQVWDRRRGEIVAEKKVADDLAEDGVDYTDDGKRIVIGETSGMVFQLNADTLEPIAPSVEVGGRLRQVIAGNDHIGTFAIMGETYASIDFVHGTALQGGDLGLVANFADISPDGRWLAVGATTGEVGVVDIRTGEWVRTPIAGHSNAVYRVAYAGDGATFVTSGLDGRVILWDGRTGALLSAISPGRSNAHMVAQFLDDGHTVVMTDIDGAIRTWDTSLDHWIEFACALAGRNLTIDEWSDTFVDRPYRQTCSAPPG